MQPIYKQFIEPDCEFPFNKLNRNLCFGGGGGGVPALKAPSLNAPTPNLDQRLNLNQAMTGSVNTAQLGTPSTGNAPSIQGPPAMDTTGLETVLGAPKRLLDETIGPEGLLAYPYRQLSVYNSPFGGSGDGGGDDYGTSDTATDTTAEDMAATESTSAMTEEEKQNRIRRLMASRYGRRQTILTGGTGIQGFGEV